MTAIYPNIVPENNLRLPDALTIKHGPTRLLSKFVLEGDKAARRVGVRLRLRHDFGDLLYLNKREAARGHWYRLMHMFNPECTDLSPENSYWISAENEHGEIVATQAGRVYYWPETSLAEEARLMLYGGTEEGQRCEVTAQDAYAITGVVFFGGSIWVRPDFRRRHLSRLLPRLGRAYAMARWPIDWGISMVKPDLVALGIAAGYGYKHESRSIRYPGSPWGDLDLVLVSLSPAEACEDFAQCLVTELARADEVSSSNFFDHELTNISPEGVFHGSSSLS